MVVDVVEVVVVVIGVWISGCSVGWLRWVGVVGWAVAKTKEESYM